MRTLALLPSQEVPESPNSLDKQWAVPLYLDLSLTHIFHCQGQATARTSPSNTKQEEEIQPSLLGCPDQAVEKSPTFLGPPPPPTSLCRTECLRGVCMILDLLLKWWTEPNLSSICRGLAFTGWKGRVWMRCVFLWLYCLPRQGMEDLLEPMGSTPLDDLLNNWFQALEPSPNPDGGQKGTDTAQVVSSSKTHWSRFRNRVWPMR